MTCMCMQLFLVECVLAVSFHLEAVPLLWMMHGKTRGVRQIFFVVVWFRLMPLQEKQEQTASVSISLWDVRDG